MRISVQTTKDKLQNLPTKARPIVDASHVHVPEGYEQPHIHAAIAEMIETAKEHEQKITTLYEAVGRKPSKVRSVAGKILGNVNDALANLQFVLGGAAVIGKRFTNYYS